MLEKLCWDDIVNRYPEQWVSLSDLELDDKRKIVSAIVFAADPNLEVVASKSKGTDFDSHAFRFTGRIHPQVGLMKWGIDE